jgi:predicted TIM-barrel fold metal-dependent hydrolase
VKPPIDFHSHFFSRAYFDTLAHQSPLPGDPVSRLAAASASGGFEVPSPDVAEHLARWTAEWDRHGVAHAVSFSSLPEETAAVAEAAALSKGRMIAFGLVNPKMTGAEDRARELLGPRGFRGVLLFPAMHQYRVSGHEAAPVLEIADRARACVVVHCGLLQVRTRDLLGLPRRMDLSFADPLDVIPAANRYPRARFVIPHFGAGLFRETLMAGAQCENVYVDTSSSNSWMSTQSARTTLADVFDRALGVFGPSRILFGTDSSTFPRGWRADLFAAQSAALDSLDLPDADREAILSTNARRLLSL